MEGGEWLEMLEIRNGLKKCAHGDEKRGWRGVHVSVFYWNGK